MVGKGISLKKIVRGVLELITLEHGLKFVNLKASTSGENGTKIRIICLALIQ